MKQTDLRVRDRNESVTDVNAAETVKMASVISFQFPWRTNADQSSPFPVI